MSWPEAITAAVGIPSICLFMWQVFKLLASDQPSVPRPGRGDKVRCSRCGHVGRLEKLR